MKFLIAGAGAIGAYIGARMAHAGLDVTLFARGPHLRAMQERGVQVKSGDGDFVAKPKIAGTLQEVGPAERRAFRSHTEDFRSADRVRPPGTDHDPYS